MRERITQSKQSFSGPQGPQLSITLLVNRRKCFPEEGCIFGILPPLYSFWRVEGSIAAESPFLDGMKPEIPTRVRRIGGTKFMESISF